MRSTKTADEIYEQMEAMLKENDLEITRALPKRNKRKKLDDFYLTTSTGQRDDISDSESMRTQLFYPAIDRMIAEMRERFSPQCENVMLGINACNPAMESFMNLDDLKRLATHYKLDISESEIAVAKNFIKAVQLTSEKKFTMEKVYSILDPLAFPCLKKLFQVALTVPVTSCTCERSFSCLRRVKTWLWTRMTQDRLDHLAVLGIESDTYMSCSDDDLVSAFINLKQRRQ